MGSEEENITQGTAVKAKWYNNKFFGNLWVRLALYSFLLNMIIESLNRLSVIKMFSHLFTSPLVFLYNTLMIFFTMTFVAFFKKRIFATSIVTFVWLVLGVVNCIISVNRKTPFTAPDFLNIAEGFRIIDHYLSPFLIVMLIILVLAIIAGIVFAAIKSPKYTGKINFLKCGLISAVCFGILSVYTMLGNATGLLAPNFGNIRQAYRDYGFGYCFSSSIFKMGIDKPKDYSKDKVNELMEELNTTAPNMSPTEENPGQSEQETSQDIEKPEEKDRPNIIFVQLESLFDPTLIKGLEFSEDPIPNLRELYKNYSSGYLSVPSFGAGTANTEFEVITGMNLDDFGPGEYPYKTVLHNNACESVGYYLKDYGYTINALHDNDGDFYQRNTVFSRLGFDTFTSIEYIENYEETPIGWAKDKCLTGEITDILDGNSTPDFIYAISVQGHGDYPEDTSGMELPIKVTNDNVTGIPVGFEYYVNEVHEMDEFVGELISVLGKRDDKNVVVFYGDHLPTIDVTDDDLVNGSIFQTEYVVWDNFGLAKEDADLEAFQLSASVLDRVGMKGGIIQQYHINSMNNDDQDKYLEDLRLLEYDILYGECNAYDGELPYTITNLKMGHKNITIDGAKNLQGHAVVTGKNFTKSSVAMVNGKEVSTIFNTSGELILDECQLNPGDSITVVQMSAEENVLSSTSIYVFR